VVILQEGLEPREFLDFIMGWELKTNELVVSREWRELKLLVGTAGNDNAEEISSTDLKLFVQLEGYLDPKQSKFA